VNPLYRETVYEGAYVRSAKKMHLMQRENERWMMGTEDELSKIREDHTRVAYERVVVEEKKNVWKTGTYHYQFPMQTLDLDACYTVGSYLYYSKPKYMNYVRYRYNLKKTLLKSEAYGPSSRSSSSKKSKSSRQSEYFTSLNWEQLDEYLEFQKNWDTEQFNTYKEVVETEYKNTVGFLKNRTGYFTELPKCTYHKVDIPVETMMPTYVRRFFSDIIKSLNGEEFGEIRDKRYQQHINAKTQSRAKFLEEEDRRFKVFTMQDWEDISVDLGKRGIENAREIIMRALREGNVTALKDYARLAFAM
jgi:hypothetical protein